MSKSVATNHPFQRPGDLPSAQGPGAHKPLVFKPRAHGPLPSSQAHGSYLHFLYKPRAHGPKDAPLQAMGPWWAPCVHTKNPWARPTGPWPNWLKGFSKTSPAKWPRSTWPGRIRPAWSLPCQSPDSGMSPPGACLVGPWPQGAARGWEPGEADGWGSGRGSGLGWRSGVDLAR